MRKILIVAIFSLLVLPGKAQDSDTVLIRKIYDAAFTDFSAYNNLRWLCKETKGRICGSPQAAAAVEWSYQVLQQLGVDTVYRQPIMVRNWKRGEAEFASMNSSILGASELTICALGGAVGTGPEGIHGKIIKVNSFEELKSLGKSKVKGKIVFFNAPADQKNIYTFASYGGVAQFRVNGASEAAKYGASAVIVRSLTLALDDNPHTGIMRYDPEQDTIPAVAISTLDADMLDFWLLKDPELNVFIRTTCYELPEAESFNVIGEIKGSENPEEVIVFGGHLDAWDNSEGAHDDGGGVVQTIDVLRIFLTLGIRPKHTLRCVVFMDEEVAQRGGKKYAEEIKKSGEKHIAAIESDRGVFIPTGFSIDANDTAFGILEQWKPLFQSYGVYQFSRGGSGVDIGFMKELNIPLMALVTDSQRYFDYHHAPSDVFDAVNRREMQMGTAALTALIYLIDKYGLAAK